MPQPKKGPRLGSNPKHQKLMLSNLARSLFAHERITTTEAKAKMLRPFAERLITKAKKGTVAHRRQVLSVVEDRDIVHKLFSDIAPRFTARNGGYTRILKLGPRGGDGAPMALVELVEEGAQPVTVTAEAEGGKRRLRRPARRSAAPEVEGTEEAIEEEEEFVPEEVAEEPQADQEPGPGGAPSSGLQTVSESPAPEDAPSSPDDEPPAEETKEA